eukprot:TRINITY_DN6954_c0_g1_i1.p1 TRINITY_DN6954_c0_g1~~TRINITY_DN6954_c0_g1_i1.p1  ORF type:complete len:101 (+),score=14.92 TRINITY_DN6954_c0_g1_i1:246-548(+)
MKNHIYTHINTSMSSFAGDLEESHYTKPSDSQAFLLEYVDQQTPNHVQIPHLDYYPHYPSPCCHNFLLDSDEPHHHQRSGPFSSFSLPSSHLHSRKKKPR